MLDFLVLPGFWLLLYILGRVTASRPLVIRQYSAAAVSLVLLFFATSPRTSAFYAVLGLLIVVPGLWMQSAGNQRVRKAVCTASITGVVLIIALYLGFRVYFQKYFEGLPSLSYLGFRGIAYLVSAYAVGTVTLGSGLAQMFFLPMLFMGPIARVENFQQERYDPHEVLRRLARGFPMLIAAKLIQPYVLERVLTLEGVPAWKYWLGAVANSFQFYFTFAGYTHLIIGLGLLAGFKLPENFNNPYIAQSIGDFWRRWHMSLSFWIRDYVYIPLGGNRKGITRKCFNLLLAMGVCGLWHGLELHYLLWGLYHGALLAVESVMAHRNWHPLRSLLGPSYVPVKVVLVFGLVTFSWLLFKYPTPDFLAFLGGLAP
jgi:D-alanyl-lipoteichoic acid acyltransferase DltB (MBOAT superfamily)